MNPTSAKLLEFLTQQREKSEIMISIQQLNDLLQLNGKYARIGDFKRYVIFPALDDIKAHSAFKVYYDQINHGSALPMSFLYEEAKGE